MGANERQRWKRLMSFYGFFERWAAYLAVGILVGWLVLVLGKRIRKYTKALWATRRKNKDSRYSLAACGSEEMPDDVSGFFDHVAFLVVEIARNIGADYVVTGNLVKYGTEYILTLKLHDTQTGSLLSSDTADAKDIHVLRKATSSLSRQLILDGIGGGVEIEKRQEDKLDVVEDKSVVRGGGFSLDVVGESSLLAEQIARLEKVIKSDLDRKEAEVRKRAREQWTDPKFVTLRQNSPKVAINAVKLYQSSYSSVEVSYPEKVSIPLSIALSRKVLVSELKEADYWLRDNGGGRIVVGYKGVLIPAGSFKMGCTPEQGGNCYDDERPVHIVTISQDFYMMESEVTQGLYKSLMRRNPSKFRRCGLDCPVEQVSWYDAVMFATILNKREGLEQCYQSSDDNKIVMKENCYGWRLPTEAEWEYAARGNEGFKYAGSSNLNAVSWNHSNSENKRHKVCRKEKNGFDLCDMSGNVSEWTWDWKGAYSSSVEVDPTGASFGTDRVNRGGDGHYGLRFVRVSNRSRNEPTYSYRNLGFRLVRTAN